MYNHDDAFQAWGQETFNSQLYVEMSELEQIEPSLLAKKVEA
jgi:hypothetical protein